MVVKIGNKLLVCAAGALLALVLSSPAAAWTWPVEGSVLRPFVAEDDPYAGGQHRGIDIAADPAPTSRLPRPASCRLPGSFRTKGSALTIRTPDGYSITLVHLGSIGMPPGTAIEEGEVVGTIGPSGDPEWVEPYVHLGIRLTAEPHGYVDPLSLLPARDQPSGTAPGGAGPLGGGSRARQQGVEPPAARPGQSPSRAPSGRRGLRVRARTDEGGGSALARRTTGHGGCRSCEVRSMFPTREARRDGSGSARNARPRLVLPRPSLYRRSPPLRSEGPSPSGKRGRPRDRLLTHEGTVRGGSCSA